MRAKTYAPLRSRQIRDSLILYQRWKSSVHPWKSTASRNATDPGREQLLKHNHGLKCGFHALHPQRNETMFRWTPTLIFNQEGDEFHVFVTKGNKTSTHTGWVGEGGFPISSPGHCRDLRMASSNRSSSVTFSICDRPRVADGTNTPR